ncbi:hypothetical protein AcV7_010006 [Taiwanofungus camphoratus]|nr:hypothetical protein AcV7_010006 [Antrodia cinnamomea]
MASCFEREDPAIPYAGEQDDAVTIVDEGYLAQKAGVDPRTGDPWKPQRVSKNKCIPGATAAWEAVKAYKRKPLPVLLVQTLTVLILHHVRHRVLSVSASSKQTSDDEDGSSRDAQAGKSSQQAQGQGTVK